MVGIIIISVLFLLHMDMEIVCSFETVSLYLKQFLQIIES